jgi:uncharacterized membrane protein
MAATPERQSRSLRRVAIPPPILFSLRVAMVGVFVGGGIMKLAGAEAMIRLFADVGVGQWLRYAVGAVEVVGGTLLLVPSWSALAALGLIVLMIGAAMAELLIIRRAPIAAVACAVALMIVAIGALDQPHALPRPLSRARRRK